MTTPPPAGQHPTSPDRQPHTTITSGTNGLPNTATPHAGRRGLPGWAWALIGALIVVALVVAGIIIAGRNTPSTHPVATPTLGVSSSPSVTTSPSTTSSSPTETTTPVSSSSPTVTGPAEVGGWSVEVLEYSPDVNDILATADHPVVIEGHKWVGVKLRVTNNGTERADPYVDLDRYIIGISKGTYYEHHMDTAGYHGDEYLVKVHWLEQGETGEGWLYYQVPGDFTPTVMSFQDQRTDPDPPETFILIPTTN